jgi:hypothetical protein
MVWEVEHTNEFAVWWMELEDQASMRVAASVNLLATHGPYFNSRTRLALTDRATLTCGN